MKDWSLTSLREKLIKFGARVDSHGRYIAFQSAEVATARRVFAEASPTDRRSALATDLRADMTRLTIYPPATQRARSGLTCPDSVSMPRNARPEPSAGTEGAMAVGGSAAATGKATRMRRIFGPNRLIPADDIRQAAGESELGYPEYRQWGVRGSLLNASC